MIFDTKTLAFILGLVYVTQVVSLYIQYRIGSKTYHGIGWWLLGSGLMALGVIFMPMVTVESLEMLARIANPLVVLGLFFLNIGLMRFFELKMHLRKAKSNTDRFLTLLLMISLSQI